MKSARMFLLILLQCISSFRGLAVKRKSFFFKPFKSAGEQLKPMGEVL